MSLRAKILGFCVLLLAVDSYLYFRHAGHFFQADSIYLLYYRASSVPDFLREFTALHPSGWYRPLANETVPSIFYPIFGLSPIPYRIPVYALFIAISAAVYALVLALTRRHLPAGLATLFFSMHTTNAYTTYDVGFMPELLYTLFYLCCALAYMQYVRTGSKRAYGLSLALFAAGLWSKEAAVTLPAALIALHLFLDSSPGSIRTHFLTAIRSTVPHILVMFVYLAFAVGYLNVAGVQITKVFDRPENASDSQYNFVLDNTIMENAGIALSFAFNIPHGWWGQWQEPTPAMLNYLKFFAGMLLAFMAVLLIRPERKLVLLGIAWFFITVSPALPLLKHFIPYYLFLPIVGLSLVVGTAFAWAHDMLRRLQPVAAAAFVVAMFAGLLAVTSHSIGQDVRNNRLLGGSAQLAFNSLADLKRLHPTLPPKTTMYFNDVDQPLNWEHSWGGLIEMAYGASELKALYASSGDGIPEDAPGNLLVFGLENDRVFDQTAAYRANPARFIRYTASEDYKLSLSADEVAPGETYAVNISGMTDAAVKIAYALNDGPVESFITRLDGTGKATFNVSPKTKKGIYRFLGFSIAEQNKWIRANNTITVR